MNIKKRERKDKKNEESCKEKGWKQNVLIPGTPGRIRH